MMIADEDKADNLKLKGSIKDLNNELRTLKSQLKASEEVESTEMEEKEDKDDLNDSGFQEENKVVIFLFLE